MIPGTLIPAHLIEGTAAVPVASETTPDVVGFLRRGEAYPDRPAAVEVRETHISWVFLTPGFAYKLKKPVRFEFLDFRSLENRRLACLEEVRLNRRLAPRIYLGVLPVVRTAAGKLQLGGAGTTVDYVVHMKRLPAERMLDRLAREGLLTSHDLSQLAAHLLPFYLSAPPVSQRPENYRAEIERHVRANLGDLLAAADNFSPQLIQRVHAAQLTRLALNSRQFDDRVCDGRLIDGHGDLRPEHVCLGTSPAVFDCLEFSQELREVDVADELSFLAMECDLLGAPQVGRHVWNAYSTAAHDRPPEWMLSFYRSYRACVRAKVAVLRAAQTQGDEAAAHFRAAKSYLELADSYSVGPNGPFLLVVRGLSGTGKSTLANALGQQYGIAVLRTDEIRREMFAPSPAAQSTALHAPAGHDAGRYAPELRNQVYDEMLRRAGQLLGQRVSAVVDGTFLTTAQRAQAIAAAQAAGAKSLVIECRCPAAVAQQRIADRLREGGDASEAQVDLYPHQASQEESDPPGAAICLIDTQGSLPEQTAQVRASLARVLAIL